jgi:hypothetical protein
MTQDAAPDEKAHPGKASLKNLGHTLKALRKLIEKENQMINEIEDNK